MKRKTHAKKDYIEIGLRWLIILSVLAMYHLVVGAIAIHIYN